MKPKAAIGNSLAIVLCLVIGLTGSAQPVLSSKQHLFDYDVYQDHAKPNLFYYSPPGIVLKRESSGAPAFTLIQMRYTGTQFYSDSDFKGFLNILQLSVNLEPIATETYDQIRQTLGTNKELKPLPVRQFYGELIIPLGDAAAANEKYRKVGLSGSEGEGPAAPGSTFWQERTFTLQLDNNEAQLLWDQVETGKLAISFSYSFYAEAIPGKIAIVDASGTRGDVVESMEDVPEELVFDDKVNTYMVKANTFPIDINVKQFPDCLKRVDINEELPPAYAAFDVRCYDFADGLRPDLFKKIVEIKAFAAAKEFITIKTDFSQNKPDLHSVRARFPYAIRLDQPLEYRVIEINKEGEVISSPWNSIRNWTEVIDVTTPVKENTIGKKTLDIEIDLTGLQQGGFREVKCELSYQLSGKPLMQTLQWAPDDTQPMKSIVFQYDLNQPVRYRMIYEGEERKVSAFRQVENLDDYLFVEVIHE